MANVPSESFTSVKTLAMPKTPTITRMMWNVDWAALSYQVDSMDSSGLGVAPTMVSRSTNAAQEAAAATGNRHSVKTLRYKTVASSGRAIAQKINAAAKAAAKPDTMEPAISAAGEPPNFERPKRDRGLGCSTLFAAPCAAVVFMRIAPLGSGVRVN